jgi:A/G-specific adenine glycosylase
MNLLKWYDMHARDMPWRVPPGDRKMGIVPNPYHIWLSEVMLQQTTVAAVKSYYRKFVEAWPTIGDLAVAQDADVLAAWAGLGYYARARNLLKCARVIAHEMNGVFPDTYGALLKLPGIGPYTAAALASIAFNQRAVVLDGNVERVMARLYRVEEPLPESKKALHWYADQLTPNERSGDYAQAVMDLGATICTPRSPNCGICPWMQNCEGRKMGDAATYPRKMPKKIKPVRQGVAFVAIRNNGAVLMERRPDKGLLGGMLGWPGTEWCEEVMRGQPPMDGEWREAGDVRHTFTHFHLELSVFVAKNVEGDPSTGSFLSKEIFSPSNLPTVMRKVWDVAKKR